MALSNKEVSKYFKLLTGLLEVNGESDFRTKSYANAAFQLGRLSEQVMTVDEAVLEKLPGVGKGIAAKIIELRETGNIAQLDALLQQTPPGIVDMLHIKGLGGKKVRDIWTQLGIETVGELLYACYENRLSKLKGFGEKTQAAVIQSIEYYQNAIGKFHYATVAAYCDDLLEQLIQLSGNQRIQFVGDLRRTNNVIERMEMIAPITANILPHVQAIPEFIIESATDDMIVGKTAHDLQFAIYLVEDADYTHQLFLKTGSVAHVDMLIAAGADVHAATEADIYTSAGLPYVSPEMRETFSEVDTRSFFIQSQEAMQSPATALITDADIRGVVHNHSTWSDGKNTIAEMAAACMEKGYQYLVMSDHSKSAFYAGGLTEAQIIAQHKEIDALNATFTDFHIFKSIECDILNDGSLDYADDILSSFDLVITSVHQNLKMDIEKATERLLKAIAHPSTRILGHMTGRLILSRPGYPVHHKKIIDACAEHKVVIEINANPYRLDIDYTWIPYAMQKGVLISINPDAHSVDGINDIHWGVVSARKGGLRKNLTLNAKGLLEFRDWLRR